MSLDLGFFVACVRALQVDRKGESDIIRNS